MNYTINNLLHGAGIMARSTFGKLKKYHLQFNHEADDCWYVDFPNWPFEHHNLMMVGGARKLCAYLSDDDVHTYVDVIPSNKEEAHEDYAKLTRTEHSLSGGATYRVEGFGGFNHEVWLCPVTLFVLGRYPKYLYVKKSA